MNGMTFVEIQSIPGAWDAYPLWGFLYLNLMQANIS